jgi:hypothetical protein
MRTHQLESDGFGLKKCRITYKKIAALLGRFLGFWEDIL